MDGLMVDRYPALQQMATEFLMAQLMPRTLVNLLVAPLHRHSGPHGRQASVHCLGR